MKKILFFLVASILISSSAFAYQPTSKKVSINAVSNVRAYNNGGNNVKALFFSDNGRVTYVENDASGRERLSRTGKYVIDTNNVIHITWDNGYEETATLSYNSSTRRAVIEYNGYTLYEDYDM